MSECQSLVAWRHSAGTIWTVSSVLSVIQCFRMWQSVSECDTMFLLWHSVSGCDRRFLTETQCFYCDLTTTLHYHKGSWWERRWPHSRWQNNWTFWQFGHSTIKLGLVSCIWGEGPAVWWVTVYCLEWSIVTFTSMSHFLTLTLLTITHLTLTLIIPKLSYIYTFYYQTLY